MKRFGEKLRTLRSRQGLTLRQLSGLLGVGYSYIGKMERGEKMPNAPMIVTLFLYKNPRFLFFRAKMPGFYSLKVT